MGAVKMKMNELDEHDLGVLLKKFFLGYGWARFMFILLHLVHFCGFWSFFEFGGGRDWYLNAQKMN